MEIRFQPRPQTSHLWPIDHHRSARERPVLPMPHQHDPHQTYYQQPHLGRSYSDQSDFSNRYEPLGREKVSSPAPRTYASKKRIRALPNASRSITLSLLRPHFEKPLAEVAAMFGICMTLMKKICRKNGVARWPHRQLRGLRKSIWSIEKALHSCESEAQRQSYVAHLVKQKSKLAAILKGPDASNRAAFDKLLRDPCSPMAVHSPTKDQHEEEEATSEEDQSSHETPRAVSDLRPQLIAPSTSHDILNPVRPSVFTPPISPNYPRSWQSYSRSCSPEPQRCGPLPSLTRLPSMASMLTKASHDRCYGSAQIYH